jgi:hypothetical protein
VLYKSKANNIAGLAGCKVLYGLLLARPYSS